MLFRFCRLPRLEDCDLCWLLSLWSLSIWFSRNRPDSCREYCDFFTLSS